MRNLLFLRVLSALVLTLLLNVQRIIPLSASRQYAIYFYPFWFFYLLEAIATFLVLQEIFVHVLEPVPGLRRLGLIAFRWVSVISFIVAIGTIFLPTMRVRHVLVYVAALPIQLARGVSILELCLLAFLVLSIHSLGRSFGSRAFGICLGFGMQAATTMLVLAFPPTHEIYTVENFFVELVGMMVCLIWTAYFVFPKAEPDHVSVALPVTSPLLRWNEIAKALGHNTPHVAVGTSEGFFLQDVEKVVDKVMTKNALTSTK